MLEASLTKRIPICVLPPSLHPFTGATVFAGIPKLIHRHDDGRSDIVISGDSRLKILKVYEEDEYLAADVGELAGMKSFTQATLGARQLVRETLELWVDEQKVDKDHKMIFLQMLEEESVMLSYGVSLLVKPEGEKVSFLACESWDEWARLLVKKIGPKEVSLGPYLTKLKF